MVSLAGEQISRWGEGPVWHGGKLHYVDIEGHRVNTYDPESGEESSLEVGERVGLVIPRAAGGYVMGGDNGLAFLDPETGGKTPVADPEPDKKPQNRFNDGKCDPAGRLWAGTISTVKQTGDAALYCLEADLSLSLKYPNVTNSNGLAWSADAKTFYYIDTPSKKVRAFDFDRDTGAIDNETVAIDTADLEGSPDGMTIDENDHLWIAFCRGSAVICFDPATGKQLDRVDLPVTGVTSCTFGGADLKTLFITTGQFSNLEEEHAGRLFVTEPGVRGVAPVPFAG